MEEGGHYYTVYYTSLAVGFNEKTAYRQAVLSQMPDEVLWMDAAHMQTQQCFGDEEVDFNNVRRPVPAGERYRIQYGLHSLPGRGLNDNTKSSAYQRMVTTQMLAKESPVALKFGLLLHRLGDTYAHSRMDNEKTMYSVTATDKCLTADKYTESFGHLFHMHDPDYPFLRQDLFYSYLENLYNVLLGKVREPVSEPFRRNITARQFHDVKGDFQVVFLNLANRVKREDQAHIQAAMMGAAMGGYAVPRLTDKETKAKWLIQEIRAAALRTLKIKMEKYSPENEEGTSLANFLRAHPELSDLNINTQSLTESINGMLPPRARGGATGSW